jgi:hypothetical protein
VEFSEGEQMGKSDNSGSNFVELLTVSFIVLKLTGHITWSWWWVLSPIWIFVALAALLIAVLAGLTMFGGRS